MHTLLLVDDDPDVLATLTRSFRKGYKTLSANGGEEGIAFLNVHPVDLIICDQRMPNISGDQVLSHALQIQPDAIRILLTGYADVESLLTCVNDAHIYKYVTKPWDPAELNLTVVRALESLVLKRDLDTARDQLETAYKDAVVMLCLAAEGKDQDTSSHLYRVQHYTEALAVAMGVANETAAHMGLMSMLHDIGKLATPDAILKKPDKLTEEEWDIMREHPLAGVRILGNNPFYETAREISAGHHENYDGTGYPHRLRGDNIPLSARIVKIVDVFDALTTKRPYKEPWPMEEAITHIESHAGIMFDPAMVEELKNLFIDGTLTRIKSAF
ncbi:MULTISPECIES: HD domain-containing phosphohydrolase [Methylobacter]|jgi:putative two-component system response regulator|uniref:Putative two-component system response regulator n=1 Tax=Methylobacter tundripaludum TaxID=173365 RepID=A0A2S6HEE5_9GAMM|nr:HD domain-containing phosphohydrolase [Methylobacter tundripaludum]PPK75816.1 putative two-component system response regulator [Methylobacter tundripaludum]